jgi:hypothetical protein
MLNSTNTFLINTAGNKLHMKSVTRASLMPPSAPVTISSVANFPSGVDVTGTSVTNGITYNVYSFRTTGTSYTVNYSCPSPTTIYVLAVGGGGAGSNWTGGGGGGGGVVMIPVTLPVDSNTINISVGAGGLGPTSNSGNGSNGSPTTVTFNSIGSSNSLITALGGGRGGGGNSNATALTGGSGGGASIYGASNAAGNSTNYNYANGGSVCTLTNSGYGIAGGGGGAGLESKSTKVGGAGIVCNLPGIKDFNPSGTTTYGTYYWGGGGGGCTAGSQGGLGGNGGLGGGGGGNQGSTDWAGGLGDINGINPGTDGNTGNGSAGNGGANTGGGGGGAWSPVTGVGAVGGSGIVVIAFPTVSQVIAINNNSFLLPAQLTNSASAVSTIPTGWTISGSGTYYILNGTGGSSWNFISCPYSQYFFTNTTTQVVLSQSINFTARTYTLTFCSALNSTYSSGQFTVTVGGTTYFTSTLVSGNIYWNNYSCNFTIPTAGSYTLAFTFGCAVGVTDIVIF